MTEIIRALVTLPKTDGLPENAISNTWHFTTADEPTDATLDAITTALTTFYQAVDSSFSPNMSTAVGVRYYRLIEAEPRPPRRTGAITLSGLGTTALPDEVALVLSFQGARLPGLQQARRRGRIYLGCLATVAAGSTTAGNRPLAGFITNVTGAAAAFLAASDSAGDWTWVVYSPTSGQAVPVTDGWVDNAFDTQRRRGVASTSRTTFT